MHHSLGKMVMRIVVTFFLRGTCIIGNLIYTIESDYGEPNVVTYVAFITCISKLLPKGLNRDMVLDAVFGECSEKGFVDQKVISVFRTAAAPEAFRRYMSSLDESPR
jgi:hypothetical protein